MKKNILVVQLDGCPAHRLGCCGGRPGVSTHLDALAEAGAVFTNAYATSNCTSPSVVSLMTGMYPFTHKASNTASFYDGGCGFLSETLQRNGYETFVCYTNITTLSPRFGFIRGYDTYYRIGKTENWFKFSKEEGLKLRKKSLRKMLFQEYLKIFRETRFARYLRQFAKNNLEHYRNNDMGGRRVVNAFKSFLATDDKSRPFFGHINIPDTHHPYIVPGPFMDRFGMRKPTANALYFTLAPSDFIQRGMTLTDEDRQCLDAMFDACVAYVDSLLAEVVQALKDAGRFEDTMIAVFSDHGGNIGGKRQYMGSSCFTYDEEVRVPIVLLNAGTQGRFDQLVSLVDVYPTLLEEAGIPYESEALHGKSLYAAQPGHEAVFCGYPHRPEWINKMVLNYPLDILLYTHTNKTMIKNDGTKLIWLSTGAHEQYDLRSDPGERRNLFDLGSPASLALVEELRAHMARMNPQSGHLLECYPFSDCGEYSLEMDGFTHLPPREEINPSASAMRIVDVNE
jgi:arylsulfatase A-like enzyme